MSKPNAETMASITPQGRADMLRLLQETVPGLHVPQESHPFSEMQLIVMQPLGAKDSL